MMYVKGASFTQVINKLCEGGGKDYINATGVALKADRGNITGIEG